MDHIPKGLQNLIDYFSRLPGIGKKTASRLAFSLLTKTPEYQKQFAHTLDILSDSIEKCNECFHLCDAGQYTCSICSSQKRNKNTLCVIETSLDLIALEKSQSYTGKYFVLGGVISPMEGIGPNEIHLQQLIEKIQNTNNADESDENEYITEVIIALSSTLEGEATTTYISSMLAKANYTGNITRIARGIPLGSSVQYTDENTLHRAFEGRIEV